MNKARIIRLSIVVACCLMACGPALARGAYGCQVRDPGRFDTDRDGYLSHSETYGTPIASIFDYADRSNDNYLSPREFRSYCRYERTTRRESRYDHDREPRYNEGFMPGSVGEIMRRQGRRQRDHVHGRLRRELNRATDDSVSDALDSLFGD
ncbi:hypothetical protein [Salinisphaera sp.]|uniref:hypothetical protein n=1 Tax=Salinisphaera sp. TaxID=1914330 RepID=UPI002D7A1487|nr:hypothetical protein [Salinisphaera sp.]HET7313104.1 hypothetical protein [Salinisphaera sp.]